jgi:predicted DNA-binding protein
MTTQMIIRIDPKLKDKFTKLAKTEGKSTSQLVRDVIEDYIKEHDISIYVDDLWDRIGNKMVSKGITSNDIDRAIKDARKSKIQSRY